MVTEHAHIEWCYWSRSFGHAQKIVRPLTVWGILGWSLSETIHKLLNSHLMPLPCRWRQHLIKQMYRYIVLVKSENKHSFMGFVLKSFMNSKSLFESFCLKPSIFWENGKNANISGMHPKMLPYFMYIYSTDLSKETPQLIGLFSPNLVITNFMQCYLYGPIG